jgi:hypothetical protein
MTDPGLEELEWALWRVREQARDEGRNPTYAQLLKDAHVEMDKQRARIEESRAKRHKK